jgi:hypothetical protein
VSVYYVYTCVLYNVLTNVGFMFKTYELFIYDLALWNTISSENAQFH